MLVKKSSYRNSSDFAPKLIKQEANFLTKRPRTGIFLISLTFIPPLIPVVCAKEANPISIKKVEEELKKDENFVETDDEKLLEAIDVKSNFTWKELWCLIAPNWGYFLTSILVC